MSEVNQPIRVYQTDAARTLMPNVLVHAEWSDPLKTYLYPAGTRTQEPPVPGEREAVRSVGDDLDSDWEIIPDWRGVTYWLPDGSQHTISSVGVAPPEGFLSAPPPPTPEKFQGLVARAVNAKLDELARSWRYTNYISARSYIGDTHPKYAAEAAAIANYGSACFQVLDELEAGVLEGTVTMPTTVEAVLALLPPEPARPSIGG